MTINPVSITPSTQVPEWISEHRTLNDIRDNGHPFITISRQAGAGGHLLSYVLLTDFIQYKAEPIFRGWHVFDKELCKLVASSPCLEKIMGDLESENYKSDFKDFMDTLFSGQSSQYHTFKQTCKVVRMLAMTGKAIIVGRAGCAITRDLKNGFHIRLVAPIDKRVVWMMKRFKLTKDKARKTIEKQDADHTKLLKNFFNRSIDDPLLYDVTWNTGTMDITEISQSVIEIIRSRNKK